jgi:Ferritin-like domain
MKSPEREMETETMEAELFVNRTGIMTNRDLSAELIRGTKQTPPGPPKNDKQPLSSKAEYLKEGLPIGSPPIVVFDETVGKEELAADADRMAVLLDKLGERLAFERQGTRLYEGFLQKLEQMPCAEVGPTLEEVRHIYEEELEHFKLLQKAISEIGGDATVQTPSADVAGVLSHGIMQIVSDPRTTIPQTLQAMLNAELADNDGWQMLIELGSTLGHSTLIQQCEKAFQEEQEHLENVRGWLTDMTLSSALGEEAVLENDNESKPKKRAVMQSKRVSKGRSTSKKKTKKRMK